MTKLIQNTIYNPKLRKGYKEYANSILLAIEILNSAEAFYNGFYSTIIKNRKDIEKNIKYFEELIPKKGADDGKKYMGVFARRIMRPLEGLYIWLLRRVILGRGKKWIYDRHTKQSFELWKLYEKSKAIHPFLHTAYIQHFDSLIEEVYEKFRLEKRRENSQSELMELQKFGNSLEFSIQSDIRYLTILAVLAATVAATLTLFAVNIEQIRDFIDQIINQIGGYLR